MSDARDFGLELYPFLYPTRDQSASDAMLLAAVQRSTLEKCADVVSLRGELAAEYGEQLARAAAAMAHRFASGGKLLAFGNGGSATDADDAAWDCLTPPVTSWRSLPAISLSGDSATVSAVANDVGVESVFARQIIAIGEPADIALGISTSGSSSNVLAGLTEAKRRGMLTVALTGYEGGAIGRESLADFYFVARREFVPRIQEGHASLWHILLELVHASLHDTAERVV
jgi:D-sedoheptulose 7-phosphate isomerase